MGELFVADTWTLRGATSTLDVYVRTTEDYLPRLTTLIERLSQTGFGADVSTGKGEFEVVEPPTEETLFDQAAANDGCVVLSTFQPAADDPVDGSWETFTKYGKLGCGFRG